MSQPLRLAVDHPGPPGRLLDRWSTTFHEVTVYAKPPDPTGGLAMIKRRYRARMIHVWLARTLQYMVIAVIATREDLTSRRADNRMSAYVYGDILVLAATAGVYDSTIRSGEALFVVLGTVVSTYIAHVVADVVGAVFGGHHVKMAVRDE